MAGVGDQDRVEAVYRSVHPRLWRSLLAYTGDAELASDAEAEAFAQVLRRGDAVDDVEAWVWRSAYRIAVGSAGGPVELDRRPDRLLVRRRRPVRLPSSWACWPSCPRSSGRASRCVTSASTRHRRSASCWGPVRALFGCSSIGLTPLCVTRSRRPSMPDDFDSVVADRFKVLDDVPVPDTWSRVHSRFSTACPFSSSRRTRP